MTDQGAHDADTPLGGLPATEQVLLRNAPIEVALAEVRFAATRDKISADEGLQLRELLEQHEVSMPKLQPAQQHLVTLNLTPTGAKPDVEVAAEGWQMTSDDRALMLTVMPSTLVVQTTRYRRWSASIRPALEAALVAIQQVLDPELVQRIGLRYVNRLIDQDAQHPAAWIGRITPEILGPVGDQVLGPKLVNAQQQFELSLGKAQGALVRHGVFRDNAEKGAYSYLVDIDVFNTESSRYDPSETLKAAQTLNRTALSLFQHIVTTSYREQLVPYTDSPSVALNNLSGS